MKGQKTLLVQREMRYIEESFCVNGLNLKRLRPPHFEIYSKVFPHYILRLSASVRDISSASIKGITCYLHSNELGCKTVSYVHQEITSAATGTQVVLSIAYMSVFLKIPREQAYHLKQ